MTKRTYIKWTSEEHQALLHLIKEHPDNLTEAFRIHSENTGRAVKSIAQYFRIYRHHNDLPVADSKRWTVKEKNTLLKLIEQHPENFREAFRIHAENTGRSIDSIKKVFYRYRNQEDAKVCMLVLGKNKKVSPNRKNIHVKTGGETSTLKVSKWRRILNIIFE